MIARDGFTAKRFSPMFPCIDFTDADERASMALGALAGFHLER